MHSMMNMKRSANERLNKSVACTKQSHDTGIGTIIELADHDPCVRATAALFGIEESNVAVVLCEPDGAPLTGTPLSNVLEFTCNTGGSPPRAGYNGNKWVVMPLGDLKRVDNKCIFYVLNPFGSETDNGKLINSRLPRFHKWSISRIARPRQTGSNYSPGDAFDVDMVTMVSMKLAVLNDAIETKDAKLTCVMMHSIYNLVQTCKIPRLENPLDPGALADNLAKAMHLLQFGRVTGDAELYYKLRNTTHPWDWFCALRLIACGMAAAPDGMESSAALYERSCMENRNNLVLSMLFDGGAMKDIISPFYLMRILTDNVRTTNAISPISSNLDEVVLELLCRAESKLPQLRSAFVVLSVSSLSRLSLWSVRNADKNLTAMHEHARGIVSVPDAILAMYPEVQPFSHNLHYLVANLVLKGANLSRRDMKGKMITPELLLSRTKPETLLDFVQKKMDTEAGTIVSAMKNRADYPTWADFVGYLVDNKFRLATGAVETVREVYTRLALEVVSGGIEFVRAALSDDTFFLSRRSMIRFIRPLLVAPYGDKVVEMSNELDAGRYLKSASERAAELFAAKSLLNRVGEERSEAFAVRMSDLGVCAVSTARRHLKATIHQTFKDGVDHVEAPSAAREKIIDLMGVSSIDPFKMVELRQQIQERVELAEELHSCPICFETDAEMVDIHDDERHPRDMMVCTTCRPMLHSCPFCRVGL